MADRIVTKCPYCGKPHTVNMAHSFESTADLPIQTHHNGPQSSFWASDGATYALAGFVAFGGAYVVCWSYGWSVVPAVMVGLMVGVGLHVLKVVLHAPPKAKAPEPEQSVRVTMDTPLPNGNKLQLDETFGVKPRAISHVAKRIIADGQSFSRRKCYKRGACSQTEFEKIQSVMLARHWAVYDPDHPQGGVELNRHGRAVLRAVLKSTNGR